VINVSEGHDGPPLRAIVEAASDSLLDLHADEHHHRAVLTLAGDRVEAATRAVARAAVEHLDLTQHRGAHPRMGVVDVVPFVPLSGSTMEDAIRARNSFAEWLSDELGVPCHLYGPERSLPELRRQVRELDGPGHPTAGRCAVGAREVLVAYNLWLATDGLATAEAIAKAVRSPAVRALGLQVGNRVQVSCNLVAPQRTGPADVYDDVAERAPIAGAELVGLVPRDVLLAVPRTRWESLDLSEDRTIEARVERVLRR
jgi:glutamate formiminotransferase